MQAYVVLRRNQPTAPWGLLNVREVGYGKDLKTIEAQTALAEAKTLATGWRRIYPEDEIIISLEEGPSRCGFVNNVDGFPNARAIY